MKNFLRYNFMSFVLFTTAMRLMRYKLSSRWFLRLLDRIVFFDYIKKVYYKVKFIKTVGGKTDEPKYFR